MHSIVAYVYAMNNVYRCEECGKQFTKQTSLNRHVKVHNISLQEYVLKWKYAGVEPICKCGCGKVPNWNVALADYAEYVHGHHVKGREVAAETRRKIGEKNSVNMKRYCAENADIAMQRVKLMQESNQTEEAKLKRKISIKKFLDELSDEERKLRFSAPLKTRWDNGEMKEAKEKAVSTWNKRFKDGEFDFTERNQRISESIVKLYTEEGMYFSKGTYSSVKNNKDYYYKSSWELFLMQQLDASTKVTAWEYEPFCIKYNFNNSIHRYIPDFFVIYDDNLLLLEVKPAPLRCTERNTAKREAALDICKNYCWQYIEWQLGEETLSHILTDGVESPLPLSA